MSTLARRSLLSLASICRPLRPSPSIRPQLLRASAVPKAREGPQMNIARYASTAKVKHNPGFVPPTQEDLVELRERVREFTTREIPEEFAAKVDRDNEFPAEMWKKLGDAGFLGITAEEEYGGLSLGYQAHCILMDELSRASASIALSYAAHSQLCINQLTLHGTPEQKSKYLPGLIAGTKVGALAMSEHTAGSDVVSMKTIARPTDSGDGYIINGSKMWITNGPDADLIIVYAKTEPTAGSKGISTFVVDTRSPESAKGYSCARKLDKLGMRGSNTGELYFDNVFIPKENLLGGLNSGVRVLMSGLDLERLVLSAGPVGIMQACIDITAPYLHERHQFGAPLAHNQLMQALLARLHTKHAASKAYTMAVARGVDETATVDTRDCAGAIMYASERATECTLDAIQALGGMGYMNEMPAGRLLRDAKLYEIGAGTTQVRQIVIGRAYNREYANA